MPRSGKTPNPDKTEAFDFSLASKRQHQARRREMALAHSETLRYEFQRLRDKIDWDLLRQAATEDEINAALSRLDEFDRNRLPSSTAVLATVQDQEYPKLRPIPFLAESCALAMQASPRSSDLYSPRYSRDICYKERTRRGPAQKPLTNLEFWRGQAELGQLVPVKYLRRINKLQAEEQRVSRSSSKRKLTYVDIPETIDFMKKKRTTVWLPETTVAKLKNLSVTTGAPMAELFRRAVEAFLKKSLSQQWACRLLSAADKP